MDLFGGTATHQGARMELLPSILHEPVGLRRRLGEGLDAVPALEEVVLGDRHNGRHHVIVFHRRGEHVLELFLAVGCHELVVGGELQTVGRSVLLELFDCGVHGLSLPQRRFKSHPRKIAGYP